MSRGWCFWILVLSLAAAGAALPRTAVAVDLAADGGSGSVAEMTPPPPAPARRPAAPGTSRAPSPTPSAVSSSALWTTYESPTLGFRLALPSTWAPAVKVGAGMQDFSTRGAGAPLEMGAQDVWLTVDGSTTGSACAASPAGPSEGTVPVNIGGRESTLQLVDPFPNAVEPTWKAFASVGAGQRCYRLWFVTLSAETRQQQLGTMRAILATFQPTASGASSGPLR